VSALLLRLATATFIVLTVVASASPGERSLVILAGTLIDGISKEPQRHVSIYVYGDTITAVKPGWDVPPGTETVHLSSATVLPGFIDAHVHMSLRFPGLANATE